MGTFGCSELDPARRWLGSQVYRHQSTAPLQVGVFLAAGTGAAVDSFAQMYAGGPLDGEPGKVADKLLSFNDLGINRVTLVELVPGSYRQLAPLLMLIS